jgi:staphylococcal nuclease domain-containing protein 1
MLSRAAINAHLLNALPGIRAPRAGRGERERNEIKPEPYGVEATEFASRRYMQRDVEVEFEATDKSGGFIGTMYLNKTENAAITLVKEGLATVHAYSAESLSWAQALFDAEVSSFARWRQLYSNAEDDCRRRRRPAKKMCAESLACNSVD